MFRFNLRRWATRLLTAAVLASPITVYAQKPSAPPETEAVAPMSGKEVYQRVLKGTCWVLHKDGWGSGWVVNLEKKLVITNNHVAGNFDEVDVFFPTEKNGRLLREPDEYRKSLKPMKARVIDRDPTRDLALLQLNEIPAGIHALKLANASPEPGEVVRTIGSLPQGSAGLWGMAVGEVRLVVNHRLQLGNVLEVESNIPTNAGNSGGAIFNDRGEVVAVHRAVRPDAVNVSFHIDISELKGYLGEAMPLVNATTPDQFLARGQRLFRSGRLDAALAEVNETIKREPKRAIAHSLRGRIRAAKNEGAAAIADFDAALTIQPNLVEALFGRGLANRGQNKFDAALADLTKAGELEPKNIEILKQRALTLQQSGKPDEAVAEYTKAISLDDKIGLLYALRAEAHQARQKPAEAIADWKLAIARDPFHLYHNELGVQLFRTRQYKEAADSFREAARLVPNNPVYFSNLGDAQRKLGNHPDAITAYTEALRVGANVRNWDPSWTFFGRGISLRERKELTDALKDLNRAIELNAKSAEFFMERSLTHKALGSVKAAEEDVAAAAKLDPKNAVVKVQDTNALVGTWKFNGTVNGIQFTMLARFKPDGNYSEAWLMKNRAGTTKKQTDTGSWAANGDTLTINGKQAGKVVRKFQPEGDKVKIEFTEFGTTLVFERQG